MKNLIKRVKPVVEKFPRLAMVYRAIRDSKQSKDEPRDTPLGFKFTGNRIMEQGDFEVNETKIVKEFLSKTDLFINIGANIGYYCCLALKENKPTIAFEPIDTNLRYLYANIEANHWESDIDIFPLALSNKTGLLEIYGGGTGASLIKGWAGTPDYYRRLVPVSTLDNVLSGRFKNKNIFILVDIEGAENSMLQGASHFLNLQPKPVWMVEINITDHQPKGIKINPNLLSTFQLFWDAGYLAYTADRERKQVTYEEIFAITESGIDTVNVHNFLFIDKNTHTESKEY